MASKHPPRSFDVSIEIDGQPHTGRWFSESGCVTVRYGWAERTTQRGNMAPEALARMLLKEIVKEGSYDLD